MYLLLALLAGAAAKLYDDIEDNNFLQKFHNNTLMELLKMMLAVRDDITSEEKQNIIEAMQILLNNLIQFEAILENIEYSTGKLSFRKYVEYLYQIW